MGKKRLLQRRLTPLQTKENMMLEILKLVKEQAEDEGLWFEAQTAPEAYLMQELRRLHAVIESSPLINSTSRLSST